MCRAKDPTEVDEPSEEDDDDAEDERTILKCLGSTQEPRSILLPYLVFLHPDLTSGTSIVWPIGYYDPVPGPDPLDDRRCAREWDGEDDTDDAKEGTTDQDRYHSEDWWHLQLEIGRASCRERVSAC